MWWTNLEEGKVRGEVEEIGQTDEGIRGVHVEEKDGRKK